MKSRFILLLFTVFLIQSASFAGLFKADIDYESVIMDSWVGENLNTIVGKFGYPDKYIKFDNRNVYTWENLYFPPLDCRIYTDSNTFSCRGGESYTQKRQFEFDSNNIAIKWKSSYKTNNEHDADSLINPKKNYLIRDKQIAVWGKSKRK